MKPGIVLNAFVTMWILGLLGFAGWVTFNPPAQDVTCESVGQEHILTAKDDRLAPDNLTLTQCDVIKIVNDDSLMYEFAFGVHEAHIDYPGFSMQILKPDESLTINATEPGVFSFHDHLRDKAHAEFNIQAKSQ